MFSIFRQWRDKRALARSQFAQSGWLQAAQRIPILDRLDESELTIHTGVFDGIQGSVPITQSINFYNKILGDLYPDSSGNAVSAIEKAQLLEFRKPVGEFEKIGTRVICLEKSHENLRLIIFTGNHEMLPGAALENLIGS